MRLSTPTCYANPNLLGQDFWAGLQPNPDETLSEWSDKFVTLPSESAFGGGKWQTSRFPFMREIMERLSPMDPCREVVFMKCNQISGTAILNNWIGYIVHRVPGNMIVIEPTIDLARRFGRQRFDKLAAMVPEVHARIRAPRNAREAATLEKEFIGGNLVITGANSGAALRSMPCRYGGADEVDAYPANVDQEGGVLPVLRRRFSAFSRYKLFILSTPKLKSSSIIEPEFLNTDQNRYFVPCPFCDHGQVLTWEGLTWKSGRPETAMYLCEQCSQLIPHYYKETMLPRGIWQPTREDLATDHDAMPAHALDERDRLAKLAVGAWTPLGQTERRGYHLPIFYQPLGMVESWAYLAQKWTKIAHAKDQEELQAFVNTYKAETWEEELGKKLSYRDLWNRREIYPAAVPEEVQLITAFVDTQDDRLEAEARGWAPGKESWGLAMRVFLGSPADKTTGGVWAQLAEWLDQGFEHPSKGRMGIRVAGIDTGGHHAQEVYAFCRNRFPRVIATKGSNQPGAHILATHSKHKETGISLFSIGTDTAKDWIFAKLGMDAPGPGYLHWPQYITAYDEEYFEQVCGEVKVSVRSRGRVVGTRYQKIRDRNEALDLLVGNYYLVEWAAKWLGVDLNQYTFDYKDPRPAGPRRRVISRGVE